MASLRLALKLSMEAKEAKDEEKEKEKEKEKKAPQKRKRVDGGEGGASKPKKSVGEKKASDERKQRVVKKKPKTTSGGGADNDDDDDSSAMDGDSVRNSTDLAGDDSDSLDNDGKDDRDDADSATMLTVVPHKKLSKTSKEGGGGEEGEAKATSPRSSQAAKHRKKQKSIQQDDDGSEEENEHDAAPRLPPGGGGRSAPVTAKSKLGAKKNKSSSKEDSSENAEDGSASGASGTKRKAAAVEPPPPTQWVQCDRCKKWRSAPHTQDMSSLPEQWFCSMNSWDPTHNSCSIAEEVLDDHMEENDASHDGGDSGGGNKTHRRAAGVSHRGRSRFTTSLQAGEDAGELSDSSVAPYGQQPIRRKSGGGGGGGGAGGGGASANKTSNTTGVRPSASLEKVNWVQCNKCTKWRKVPGSIDVSSLPEVWHCSLNSWAPAFSRCAAKEETEEADPLIERDPKSQSYPGTGNRPRKPLPSSNLGTAQQGVKKIVQWVQCEQKSCKKWRKLPGHVDMSLLPEKWFCEMNEWDPERASCEAVEESDSEGEPSTKTDPTSQLIMSNSKNTGTLSYRRIIFGTDGRVRAAYSDKNKGGSGVFSYMESHRSAEGEAADLEMAEPKKRVSYWWSGAYDESGAQFITTTKRHPSSGSGLSAMAMKRELSKEANANEEASKGVASSSLSSSSSSSASSSSFSSVSVAPASFSSSHGPTHHLLDAARRLSGMDCDGSVPGTAVWPLKQFKTTNLHDSMTMMDCERAECTIVRSCLTSIPTKCTPLASVYEVISSAYFHAPNLEACRSRMSLDSIKSALQRLENLGEVEVVYNASGAMCVQMTPLKHINAPPPVTAEAKHTSFPLLMRKNVEKAFIEAKQTAQKARLHQQNVMKQKQLQQASAKKAEAMMLQQQHLQQTQQHSKSAPIPASAPASTSVSAPAPSAPVILVIPPSAPPASTKDTTSDAEAAKETEVGISKDPTTTGKEVRADV